ncbi:MAG: segregation/condensation protein A [Euryarchaeota archaeon]|nr:segregation/condensation protein A [Euryarchaeota archaeon]
MTNEESDVTSVNEAASYDERSIDILVSLAKKGEIDPWDIDIVDVTDKFLAHIARLEKLDLRISSRTLLFASILLRMKSDALEAAEPDGDDETPPEEDDLHVCFPALKPKVRRHAKRRVTLSELIEELKKATKRKERSDARRMMHQREGGFDALSVAHTEDIEKQVARVHEELKRRFEGHDHVLFSELITHPTAEAIVQTYIPLLFMANRRQIQLEQRELFGDILIKCKDL